MVSGPRPAMLWSLIAPVRGQAFLLLALILLGTVFEVAGMGMILPLMEALVRPEQLGASGAAETEAALATASLPARMVATVLAPVPPAHRLPALAGIAVALVLVKNALLLWRTYCATYLVTTLRRLWSCRILGHYLGADFNAVLREKQGTLIHNILHEPRFSSGVIRDGIDALARGSLSLGLIAMLMVVDWRGTLIMAAVGVPAGWALWALTRRYSLDVGHRKVAIQQDLSAQTTESVTGARQVRIFSLEGRVVDALARRLHDARRLMLKFNVVKALPPALVETVIVAMVMGVVVWHHYRSDAEMESVLPYLGFFLFSAQKLYNNLSLLFAQRMIMLAHVASLSLVQRTGGEDSTHDQRIHDATDAAGPVAAQPATETPVALRQGLRCESLRFAYEPGGPEVLRGLSLEVPVGRITALVGGSGSGKSTFCDLVARFQGPTGGALLLDGAPLAEIPLDRWRASLGYMSQDCFLFNATIRENILLARPEATEEALRRAAREAGAEAFIEALPDGYETRLGNNATTLSGGQRQRLALARAFLRDAPVWILDEATSGLDVETEARILAALNARKAGRSILLVTHRLTSLRVADQIHVLDAGVCVESGGYDQLLARGGLFASLVERHT